MGNLIPVDYDPFAEEPTTGKLVPVDFDPFAEDTIPAPTQPSYAAPIQTADFYTTMKAERMGLVNPSGVEQYTALASQQAATEKRRRERRDIVAKLQADVDRGVNLDPDLVVEYGSDLKFPEMEKPKATKPTAAKEPTSVQSEQTGPLQDLVKSKENDLEILRQRIAAGKVWHSIPTWNPFKMPEQTEGPATPEDLQKVTDLENEIAGYKKTLENPSKVERFAGALTSALLPFGLGQGYQPPAGTTVGEKIADVAGSTVGAVASFYVPGKAAGKLLESVPKLGAALDSLAAVNKYGKTAATVALKALTQGATFGIQGQLQLPTDASLESRLKTFKDSELQAALFSAAGSLGDVAGVAGQVLAYPAMFAIGYETAGTGASATDKLISGLTLTILHATSAGVPKDQAKLEAVHIMQDKYGVDEKQARKMVDAVAESDAIRKVEFAKPPMQVGVIPKTLPTEQPTKVVLPAEAPVEAVKVEEAPTVILEQAHGIKLKFRKIGDNWYADGATLPVKSRNTINEINQKLALETEQATQGKVAEVAKIPEFKIRSETEQRDVNNKLRQSKLESAAKRLAPTQIQELLLQLPEVIDRVLAGERQKTLQVTRNNFKKELAKAQKVAPKVATPVEPSKVVAPIPEPLPVAEVKVGALPAEAGKAAEYPIAKNIVDGRTVRKGIPNTSSIEASVPNNEVLAGIREVSMSDFQLTGEHYSIEGNKRIADLSEQIKTSKEITPLIVVLEKNGPYILEGSTRADALFRLGAESFPAKVIVNLDSPPEGYIKSIPPVAQVKGPGLEGVDNAAIVRSTIPVSQQPKKIQPISTKDVVSQIEESFGIPIRTGRFRSQAVGIYKQHPEVARTKVYGDIATATHEAAHHLDKTTRFLKNTPTELRVELSKLDYEPDKARSSEGFAEYLRLKVTTDNDASLKAPKFDKWFDETWLPANPEWKGKIDAVKKITTQWRQEGSVSRVVGQINKESGRFPKLKEWVKNPHDLFRGIYDAVWNRQQPLWRAQEAITGTKKLADIPAEFRFAQAAKVLNMAAPTKVRQMAETGMTDVAGNKTGAGLKESLDPINDSIKTSEGQREFEAFLYARHALDVRKAGKEPGISREDAQFTVNELGKRPGWNKAADGVTKWFDGLLDYLIDAGGLASESKAKMKSMYPNYIPLFRAMEGKQGGGTGGKKLADIGQPLQRLKGSGRQVISPLENAIVQGERIVGVADKIRIGRMLADASEHYQGVGKIIEKIAPDKKATSTTIKTMKDQLEKLGVDIADADMDAVLTIYENVYRGSTKDNVIVLWRNGKQEMYQVDPDVYSALTGLDQQFQLPKVADWILGKPTRLLRLTTTGLRAGFSMITNPLRDTMTSVMQTRTKGIAGSLPGKVAENIAGIYHDIMGTETARLFKAGGGEMGQPLAIDRVFTQEAISELLAKTPKQKVLNWAKHPVDSMRQLFSVTELGPRLAEFERVLKQKGWKEGQKLTLEQYLDAQMAAADVTVDFRQGGWMGMWLNRITAFHNANVQGPVQMVQAFKRNFTATMAKGTLWMTLPTLALWWKNKDEEWYKNLPDFEKYGYWHVPIGKSIIRVPRPFEWGLLFASIPEAIAQSAYEKDPQYMKDVVGQSLQILTPPVIPTAAKVPSEVFFDWDTFRRRPIVSKGLQNLKPEDQTYTSTTESANQLGKLLGVSPAKVEFLMSGYTGTLSTEIIRAGEAGARMLSSDIKKGTRPRELSDLPVVGRLFLRPNTTKIFDEFYAKSEELNRAYSSAKIHEQELPEQDASQRLLLNSASDSLSLLRAEARTVIANTKITDDQKRSELQKIQDEMASIAKEALNKKQP